MIVELQITIAEFQAELRATEANLARMAADGTDAHDLEAGVQKQLTRVRNGITDAMSELRELNRLFEGGLPPEA